MAKTININDLISGGENEAVEFKSSFNGQVIETIVAFSNSKGGTILIGIDDRKNISGITVGKETLQQIINEIKNKTSPAVLPDMELVPAGSKTVLAITVREYPIKPVSFKGRYFKRVKNSNHQLTTNEVVQLHQSTFNTSWDYTIDYGHTLEDISLDKVGRFIALMNKIRLAPIDDPPLAVLKKFELVRGGQITIGCFLLFGKQDTLLTTVELGRFTDAITISDALSLRGDLISQADAMLNFIAKHINKAYIITGKVQREEKYQYPAESLREVVLNMIIHRDYSHSSDSIIKVFDDRIEFFNPGNLLPPLTVEKLISGEYASVTRNKQISAIFKEAGLIEKYGSGIKRIADSFKTSGLPAPKFENYQHGFRVTVYAKTDRVTDRVTDNQKKIMALITEDSRISTSLLAEKVGISQRKIKENLKKLKDSGMVERQGSEKKGHWLVTENTKE